MPFVYILRCRDNSLYTGYTTDLARRLHQHNQGTASKYTRGRRPVQYAYFEEHPDKSTAMKREKAIKMMKKPAKEVLIKGAALGWDDQPYINTEPPGENIYQTIHYKGGFGVQISKGMVMSRENFLEHGLWSRQEYEGLIVSGEPERDRYNIGVEIEEDLILVVDQVQDHEVAQKVRTWSAEVPKIQRQYGWI